MRILALNAGSSSLKFQIVDVGEERPDPASPGTRVLLHGAIENVGQAATIRITQHDRVIRNGERHMPDHTAAVRWVFECVDRSGIEAVGHRVVHGGNRFSSPVRIDQEALAEIDGWSEFAPLHNPACVAAIRGAQEVLGSSMPMVAVFDTAFHQTLPASAATYAIPQELASKHRIRRYGFHGIAHASLAAGFSACTGRPLSEVRLITLHLGNGCSAAAIRHGRSVDTSMGFTPLEGLVMGTRAGDLDPAIVGYLSRREGVTVEEVGRWLNERSGLLGISGLTHDMRGLLIAAEERHDARARLAIELFCYRVRKYIGAYLAVLGGADAVVFGGGIGERSPEIRARICEGMEWCGLGLDPRRNSRAVGLSPGKGVSISAGGCKIEACVVAVDEETMIAQETVRCLKASGTSRPHVDNP